jgi:peptidoglycan/LPS O-acetylase OafA/YrhL
VKHDQRFVWLDLVRGASAIAVCAGHLRAATFRDYADLHDPTLFHKIFYFFTGLGHQAVMIFFVLSGFFVGGSILKSSERFNLADYSIARLTRLWTVLIPALIVTFVVDKVVAAHAPEVLRGAYFAVWHSGPQSANSYSTSVLTFIGNALFLQTILTPVFGTNGPLWSLANEFWYYATFPLFAIAAGQCGSSCRILARMVSGVMAALLLLVLPTEIRSGYLVWLMGVVIYLGSSHLPCKPRPIALISAIGIFAGSLAYSKVDAWQVTLNLQSDLAIGLGFSTCCVVLASWPLPRNSSLSVAVGKLARAVSEFSYSLYLSHFSFVVVIAVFGYRSMKVLPDREGLLYFFGWLGVLLCLGVMFWFLFERHTITIRGLVQSRLTKRFSRPRTSSSHRSDGPKG